MPGKRRTFRSATALGLQITRVPAASPAPEKPAPRRTEEQTTCCEIVPTDRTLTRFTVQKRDGRIFSYPYALISLVELPSGDRLVLHCNCEKLKRIEVEGYGLLKVAEAFSEGRLRAIREASNPRFATGDLSISKIRLT